MAFLMEMSRTVASTTLTAMMTVSMMEMSRKISVSCSPIVMTMG